MSRSQELFERAKEVIPGGVNSPVRAFSAVGGNPPFIVRGSGATIVDADDNEYLDFVVSWGALLLGHVPMTVVEAAVSAMRCGSSFGAPTAAEVHFAEAIRQRVPSMEMIRLCSSGTESTMHAIRLARGFTERNLIIKVEGCYHGAHDAMLVAAGSGLVTFECRGTPGVPDSVASNTVVVPFNDLESVKTAFEEHGDQIAAIILEPVPGNMGLIEPNQGYLQGLRTITEEHGALLIFDEVMCGFRVAPGGAQELYQITPDLTCLGKVIGGGFPLAAFGGRADIMSALAPLGSVYQAGTLSGNPVAVSAGIATLDMLSKGAYDRLERVGRALDKGIKPAVNKVGWSYRRIGAMFNIFARSEAPNSFQEVKECNLEQFALFHRGLLERGVYFPPSQFEACFTCAAMTEEEVERAIEAITLTIADVAG